MSVPVGDDVDTDDLERRSDIEMVETNSGWIAVRTAAVEEQSSACQLLVLLIEKMQEHFFPYVERTLSTLYPLLESSPHDDVRSFCMVSIPELVRATGKANPHDRTALTTISDFALGRLVHAVETEGNVDLIMTGLQAIKQVLHYTCTIWANVSPNSHSPPPATPATSMPSLNEAQMKALTDCAKIVLRDSLQRRAVLRAEAQITGVVDDDDAGVSPYSITSLITRKAN